MSVTLLFLGATASRAQDVAGAARQEQAHKSAEKSAPKHVYTDDDLKKDRILTPEDEVRVAEHKRQQERTTAKANEPQQGNVETKQEQSLGEIARRYRKEKAAREAEEAAKRSYTPFHYDVPQSATAAPTPNVGPLPGVASGNKRSNYFAVIHPAAPSKTPQSDSTHGRVSPFQPRPTVAPPASVPTTPLSRAALSKSVSVPPVRTKPSESPKVVSGAGLRSVTVQTGDSWWKLADVYLGNGSRWTELRALNPGASASPELLMVGARVFVPDRQKVSPGQSRRPTQLRTRPGDTMWGLAKQHLGRGSAWACMAKVNPQILDYRKISIGTVIELPATNFEAPCAAPVESTRR